MGLLAGKNGPGWAELLAEEFITKDSCPWPTTADMGNALPGVIIVDSGLVVGRLDGSLEASAKPEA